MVLFVREFFMRCRGATLMLLIFVIAVTIKPLDGLTQSLTCHVAHPTEPEAAVLDSPAGSALYHIYNEALVRYDAGKPKVTKGGEHWVEIDDLSELPVEIKDEIKGKQTWILRRHLWCIDIMRLRKEIPSLRVLKAAGIVPQNSEKDEHLPILCDEVPNSWGVTVSHKLYLYYLKRGFDRLSVCYSLGGHGIYFDPATGKRLNLYLDKTGLFDVLRPFWVPDCFKKIEVVGRMIGGEIPWKPIGCVLRYHPMTGRRIKIPEWVEVSVGGPAGGGKDEDNRSSTISTDRAKALIFGR